MDEFGRGDFGIVWNEAEEVGQTACYLRGRTGGAQMFHVEGAVAFAQATSLGVAEQRHMGESRRLQAEKTIEVYLLGCRKQQVGASHDLGHAHEGIVDNDGKLIGPRTVGTSEYEVAHLAGEVEMLRPIEAVGIGYGLVWHIDTRRCTGEISAMRRKRRRAAASAIDNASVGLMRRLRGHYLCACAAGRLGITRIVEALQEAGIDVASPALRIWTGVSAAVEPPFVPVEAQPCEIVLYQT